MLTIRTFRRVSILSSLSLAFLISFNDDSVFLISFLIRSTYHLTNSNRELVELTPMLTKARNKHSLNLPLFKVDHTRLALDFREAESWQMPKNLVNQRVV